jgi:hypothetical protein
MTELQKKTDGMNKQVMECIIEQIKDFKEGDLYQEHLGRKVKTIRK